MKKLVFVGIFALTASTAFAQTQSSPSTPALQTTSPASPGPASICQELLAFMKAPPPEDAAEPAAAKPEAAARQPQTQEAKPAQQGSSALAGTTHAGDGASAKSENESTSAQAVTGQDGVATDAPEQGGDEKAAPGSVENAPQKESRAAPMPEADVTSTARESVMTVERAEELAATNDVALCQDFARRMRVAGVAIPPPLVALAALDLQYHPTGVPSPQTPGAEGQAAQPRQ